MLQSPDGDYDEYNTIYATTYALHVDCTPEAKSRIAALHEAFGFKTKASTFEAVLFAVSIKDKIDHVLENFDSL